MKKIVTVLLALALCVPGWANGSRSRNHTSHHKRTTHVRTTHGSGTATCMDGTTSYSQHHRGTCSHHGGVKEWHK